jgi:hypothetical protein
MATQADASDSVISRIQRTVIAALDDLPIGMRWWVRAHLIEPRFVVLCTDPDVGTCAGFWLVTDHMGIEDAPFRVVSDGTVFGLEITLDDGVSYLVHRSASFADAIEAM